MRNKIWKTHLKNLALAMEITGKSPRKLKALKLLEQKELENKLVIVLLWDIIVFHYYSAFCFYFDFL